MSCVICFEDVNDGYDCLFCGKVMCGECLNHYFNMCFREKKIPICVNKKCKFIYTVSYMKKKKLVSFNDILKKVIIHNENENNSDYVLSHIELDTQVQNIKDLLKKKMTLLNDVVPYGMKDITGMISSRVFKAHMKKKTKALKESLLHVKTRECLNNACTGVINLSTNTCAKCGLVMCDKCKERKEPDHVCSADVLATLAEISGSSRPCPKCGINIQRSVGCDHMWCTNCKTPFDYVTGEIRDTPDNPEHSAFLFGGKRITAKTHTKPDLTIEVDDGIREMFDGIYEMLGKYKYNRVDDAKVKYRRNQITKEFYEKNLPQYYEDDYITNYATGIMIEFAQEIMEKGDDVEYIIGLYKKMFCFSGYYKIKTI